VLHRVRIIRGLSRDVQHAIPDTLDFAFIDGDHSWDGIRTDWDIVSPRTTARAILCLHDTAVPDSEPWRQPDSVRFYKDVIAKDARFHTIDVVHTMTVIQKVPASQVE
jgi:hypothetical protein